MSTFGSGEEIGKYVIRSQDTLYLGGFGEGYLAMHLQTSQVTYLKVLMEYERPADSALTKSLPKERGFAPYTFTDEMLHTGPRAVLAHSWFYPGIPLDAPVSLEHEQVSRHELDDVLEKRDQRTENESWGLFIQLAEMVKDGLRSGLEHVTVTPSNLMLCKDDQLRLLDAGVHYDPRAFHAAYQSAGFVADVMPYLPPEMLLSLRDGKPFEDRDPECEAIYSLGMTMYWLLSGRLPFSVTEAPAVLHRVLDTQKKFQPPSVRSFNQRAQRILMRCIEKDPTQRFQTIDQLVREIRTIEDWQKKDPTPRSVKLAWGGAALAATVAVVTWAFWYFSAFNRFVRSDAVELARAESFPSEGPDEVVKALDPWIVELPENWLLLGLRAGVLLDAKPLVTEVDSIASAIEKAQEACHAAGETDAVFDLLTWKYFLHHAYQEVEPAAGVSREEHLRALLDRDLEKLGLDRPELLGGSLGERLLAAWRTVFDGQALDPDDVLRFIDGIKNATRSPIRNDQAAMDRWPVRHLVGLLYRQIDEAEANSDARVAAKTHFLDSARHRPERWPSISLDSQKPQHPRAWQYFVDIVDDGDQRLVSHLEPFVGARSATNDERQQVRREFNQRFGKFYVPLLSTYIGALIDGGEHSKALGLIDSIDNGEFFGSDSGIVVSQEDKSKVGEWYVKAATEQLRGLVEGGSPEVAKLGRAVSSARQAMARVSKAAEANELRSLTLKACYQFLGNPEVNNGEGADWQTHHADAWADWLALAGLEQKPRLIAFPASAKLANDWGPMGRGLDEAELRARLTEVEQLLVRDAKSLESADKSATLWTAFAAYLHCRPENQRNPKTRGELPESLKPLIRLVRTHTQKQEPGDKLECFGSLVAHFTKKELSWGGGDWYELLDEHIRVLAQRGEWTKAAEKAGELAQSSDSEHRQYATLVEESAKWHELQAQPPKAKLARAIELCIHLAREGGKFLVNKELRGLYDEVRDTVFADVRLPRSLRDTPGVALSAKGEDEDDQKLIGRLRTVLKFERAQRAGQSSSDPVERKKAEADIALLVYLETLALEAIGSRQDAYRHVLKFVKNITAVRAKQLRELEENGVLVARLAARLVTEHDDSAGRFESALILDPANALYMLYSAQVDLERLLPDHPYAHPYRGHQSWSSADRDAFFRARKHLTELTDEGLDAQTRPTYHWLAGVSSYVEYYVHKDNRKSLIREALGHFDQLEPVSETGFANAVAFKSGDFNGEDAPRIKGNAEGSPEDKYGRLTWLYYAASAAEFYTDRDLKVAKRMNTLTSADIELIEKYKDQKYRRDIKTAADGMELRRDRNQMFLEAAAEARK